MTGTIENYNTGNITIMKKTDEILVKTLYLRNIYRNNHFNLEIENHYKRNKTVLPNFNDIFKIFISTQLSTLHSTIKTLTYVLEYSLHDLDSLLVPNFSVLVCLELKFITTLITFIILLRNNDNRTELKVLYIIVALMLIAKVGLIRMLVANPSKLDEFNILSEKNVILTKIIILFFTILKS